jgi:cell division cycle 20-like protein 1, cofactor of APC complex
MENSASSKPPTPASTPNSRLASAPSPRHSATPPHASAPASAPAPASRTVYSDRFIPSRAGSNLALFDLGPSPSPAAAAASSSSSHEAGPAASSGSAPAAASPYCALLRAALFGPDTPDRVASSAAACSSSSSSPGLSPVGTPATGNIFRFKTEVRRNAKRALFSGGEEEEDALFPGIFTTRGAGPRKVPRSPYKVRRAIGFPAFLI